MSGGAISLKLSYNAKGTLTGTETYAGIPGDEYWTENYEEGIPTTIKVDTETGFVMPNGFMYIYPAKGAMPAATEYLHKERKVKALRITEVRKLV